MSDEVHIELLPLGRVLQVARGMGLQQILFDHGVEFPCGGRGRCKGCKIRVLAGLLPITSEDRQKLSAQELAEGWRLACRARADADLKLDLAQWEAPILSDETTFEFIPRAGWGVAIDLGTTTVVAQLLDLKTGHVLAVGTALNAQAQHGADIMSRIEFASVGEGQRILERLIRDQIGKLIKDLLASVATVEGAEDHGGSRSVRLEPNLKTDPMVGVLQSVVVVGNTVMHHLFCGLSVEPLSRYPFESPSLGLHILKAKDLGWALPGDPEVYFLACPGGFVGSDILAGVLACRPHESDSLVVLLDLGTNGEIVVGNQQKLLCTSTAAGPAFEGARISMGMRAATGAISEVRAEAGGMVCRVLGDGAPRGICGSGLVDAVAVGLDLGSIGSNGRLAFGDALPLSGPVSLSQWDIRELQLAKGAIAAGLRILLEQWGATKTDVTRVFLAGAFGNYINQASSRRIGLLNFPAERIVAAGNTALLGAKLALFTLPQNGGDYASILSRLVHVSLKEDPGFQEAYVEEMTFPKPALEELSS